uniref:G-protein coupled receptors family 1 profile domain-containing protein n=1 Tax=Romanomermis culicivorax TaxID=13658 RepID=A0A915L0K9_ROMCU
MSNNTYENIHGNPLLENNDTADDECTFHKHDWLEAKFYLTAVCGSSVAVFGMVANFLTVCVLTRPSMRSANNLFLTALALFDICVLVSAVALYAVEYVAESTDNVPLYGAWVSYISAGYALSNIAQTGSTYVTVAVTIERYIAVVHHKRREWMCGTKGAGTSIFWVFCFSVVYNLPKFFEIETVINENCTGLARFGLKESALQSDNLYSMVYSLWITQMVMVFVPFLVLLFFNAVIALKIRDDGRKRSELKEKSREVTYVLIVIVLLFLVCNSWGLIMTVMERFYGVTYLRRTCIFCFIPCPTEDTYSARHLVMSLYYKNSSAASLPLRRYSTWFQKYNKPKFPSKNSEGTSDCPVYSNDYIRVQSNGTQREVSTCMTENQTNRNDNDTTKLSIRAENEQVSTVDDSFPTSTNNGCIRETLLMRQKTSNGECTILKLLSDKHDSWV